MSSPVWGGRKKKQTQLHPNPVNPHFLQHGFARMRLSSGHINLSVDYY